LICALHLNLPVNSNIASIYLGEEPPGPVSALLLFSSAKRPTNVADETLRARPRARTSPGWRERLSKCFSENPWTGMMWESHSGTMEFNYSRQDGSRVSGDERACWMRVRLVLQPNERENSRGRPQPGLRIMWVMTTVGSSRCTRRFWLSLLFVKGEYVSCGHHTSSATHYSMDLGWIDARFINASRQCPRDDVRREK
jgi:hypothetical protein